MLETLRFPRHLAVALLAPITALALLLAPALARADTSSTLTVVGTSDVADSGLIPNVIQPGFNKAFPQFTFKYVGSATGAAIQNAENGTGGPSVLIVHAASLENQFVANGFSYNNQFGNAIWINDFVLAGPTGDPAGVAGNAANNIAQAFADVAAAGAAGHATMFTRGGTTTASGTTVEEHSIWALVHSTPGLQPASLSLCVVSAADGGGMSPVASAALNGQPCPNSGTVQSPNNPSWYFINAGSNQAANVVAANACPPADAPAGPNTCYVLTDRGTYDYLASGTDPAGSVPNLKIVTRGPQSASAPGGVDALVNYFHAYIINPSKPGETVNLTAAQDFVDYLTSPAVQSQLKSYLANTSDPAGPPFVADASPIITAHFPHVYRGGKPAKVTGTVTNAEPGYPTPAGAAVNVDEIRGALVIPVGSGKTNSSGQYSIKFVPPSTGSYEVSTGQISMIENPSLSPQYGDILSPGATAPVKVTVHTATPTLHATSQGGKALVFGTVVPRTGHGSGTVTVLARALGNKGSFRKVAIGHLTATEGNFAVSAPLRRGDWQVQVRFQFAGNLATAGPGTVNVSVGAAPTSGVSVRSVHTRKGKVTVFGRVAPAAPGAGAKVVVLGLDTSPGAPARFLVLGRATLAGGGTTVTLHFRAKRKVQWLLQLAYVRPGQPTTFSALKAVALR